MKKFTLFLFTLVIGFITFCGLVVKADAITIALVDAAQVRTDGDYQGLRFQASVNTLEGTTEHGFFLALGTHSLSEMTTAINGGSATVGANKLLKKETTGEDLTFAVTIFDIPEAYYTTGITAMAYAYDGSSYTLSSIKVTRNIAEVAIEAKNFIKNSTIINNVCTYAASIYMTAAWDNDGTFKLSHTIYDHNYKTLAKQFLADWNAKFSTSLTSFTASTFYNSAKPAGCTYSAENASNKDISDSNLYRFFNDTKYGAKWGWLLDYIDTIGSNQGDTHSRRQVVALKGNGTNGTYALYGANHIIASIVGFFTKSRVAIWHWGLNFSIDSAYTALASIDEVTCSKNDYGYYKSGETLVLPEAIAKTGYTWVGYTDSNSDVVMDAESSYPVTLTPNTFTPTYDIITYTITYVLNDGLNSGSNPETYTIVSNTINLQNPTRVGFAFGGWYEESDFSDSPVTSIPSGSHRNITLHAKFVLTDAYVNAAWTGYEDHQVFEYDAVEYEFGGNAFRRISDAIGKAANIHVFAGTYSDSFTISSNGTTLIGPNNNVTGYSASREEEAIITGTITLAKGLADCSILGFKFEGTSNIVNTTGDAGTAANPATNLNGFTFSYNKVSTALTSGSGFIAFTEAASSYSHDLAFEYDFFDGTNQTTSSMISLDNNANLTVSNSKFVNITGDAVRVDDVTKGAAGDIIFLDNTFLNITKSAIWMDWYSPLPNTTPEILIRGNYLESVNTVKNAGAGAIDFEASNTGDVYSSIRVEKNVFKHTFYCLWMSKTAGTVFTNNVIYKYDSSTRTIVAKGSGGYSINCNANLYLTYDGSSVVTTVYSTNGSTGYEFNANTTNVDASNYASIVAYNDATGLSFSVN